MKLRSIAGLIIIAMVVLLAGCTASRKQASSEPAMKVIDAALEKGPVLVEFGAPWCDWCTREKPIIEQLKGQYTGMTFIDIDVDNNSALAQMFYVDGIPQMNVLAKKNPDGSYVYVDHNGDITGDRKASAIIGYTEKEELKKPLDAALKARGG